MHRVTIQELMVEPGIVRHIAQLSDATEADVQTQIRELNDRVRPLLRSQDGESNDGRDPITVKSNGGLRADGVAGLLRLNSRVEMEVVPKFLDKESSTWRSDFFLLAVLVKTGHLLLHDEISADEYVRGDLATLIARSFLNSYAENTRRTIRGYRRAPYADYAIDGDVDWESTILPGPDGFSQSRLELSRRNPYNATLLAAAEILIGEVSDTDTEAQLHRVARRLSPQDDPPSYFPPLPTRHSSWERAYDLAKLVVRGLGLSPDLGGFTGPGFVLSTWPAWESLCEEVVRRAMPDHVVHAQHQWLLGIRGDGTLVFGKPDISPVANEAVPFLLDAKYKTRMDRKPKISSTDLYESLAFLRAANTQRMCLLYPSMQPANEVPLGRWEEFDQVAVDNLLVQGFEVQIRGLSRKGGFSDLVAGARKALVPLASSGLRETSE